MFGILQTRRLTTGLVIFLALVPCSLIAQSVYWQPGSGTLGQGKTTNLSLVFENVTPTGDLILPTVPGLDFGNPSVSQQTSMSFGQGTTRRVSYTYRARPSQKGTLVIPAFEVQTESGPVTVEEARFEVTEPSVGQGGIRIEDLVQSQITTPQPTAWVGEVVNLEYLLAASEHPPISLASDPAWNPSGMITEPFGPREGVTVTHRGVRRPAVRYSTRFIPTAPGILLISAVQQRINVQTGERGGFFMTQPRFEEFLITSNSPSLEVRDLPQPAPDDFLGAVGSFTIESKIVPENASVGEPITWTLSMSGTGNWPSGLRLPERSVSADFEVVQPDAREELEDGQMFSGSLTEDAVLVPTKAGLYQLGPISFSFFDPAAGVYRTEFIDATTVTIQPATSRSPVNAPPPVQLESAPSDLGPAPGDPAANTPRELPEDLLTPAQLPRDPLPEGVSGRAPFRLAPAWWFFIAFIPPCIAWLGLAFRMVRREDETRRRRAAKRDLLALLSRMHGGSRMPEAGELLEWRRLATKIWNIDRAEPTRADIGRAVSDAGGKHAIAWAELWREAESALFGSEGELPEDWTLRALSVIREVKITRNQPGFPHRLRHWAPRLTLGILSCLVVYPQDADAADLKQARQLYHEGNFERARSVWMSQLAVDSSDWAVHNNVALAYAQEERWADAAAHWTSAMLLNPGNQTIRANLRLALTHLDGVDPSLRRALSNDFRDRAVRVRSPADWQLIFAIGAIVVAGGMVFVVLGLYWPPSRRWRRIGVSVAALGVVTSAVATYAESRYGPLAEPKAGMIVQPTELHSIPSDLAEDQQKTFLPPGSVIVMDQDFLGWHRVQAAGGSVGWVRREAITPFFDVPHVLPGESPQASSHPEPQPVRIDAQT